MHSGGLRASEYSAEIVRILEGVAHDNERALVSALREGEDIVQLGIFVSRGKCRNALMRRTVAEAVELARVGKLDGDFALAADVYYLARLAAALTLRHGHAVYRSAALERLKHCVAPDYEPLFMFH